MIFQDWEPSAHAIMNTTTRAQARAGVCNLELQNMLSNLVMYDTEYHLPNGDYILSVQVTCNESKYPCHTRAAITRSRKRRGGRSN